MDETQNVGEPKGSNNMNQNPIPAEETKKMPEGEVPTAPEVPAEEVSQM